MRLAFVALVSLVFLGCANRTPKSSNSAERSTASTPSSITLNIQAKDIKEVAVLDNTASTVCTERSKDYLDAGLMYFDCATTAKVGIRVVNEYLKIDQVYGGIAENLTTGYESRNALANTPLDVGSAKEIANIQANALGTLGRRYRKLADGCMGAAVALSYGADKIDLQTGEYFGDFRCKVTRKNAKIAAGTVYYFELAKAPAVNAYQKSKEGVMYGAQVLVETDQKSADAMGWMATQSKEKTAEAYRQTVNYADKTTAPMRAYIAATMESLNQTQQRTRTASAEVLKSWSEKIRP